MDDADSYDELSRFVQIVSEESNVRHFILHARKCLLNGLSPHQNRTVPPLKYNIFSVLRLLNLLLDMDGCLHLKETSQNSNLVLMGES